MQNRTVIRTALDRFFDNALVDTLASFVNFCNEQNNYSDKELKFSKKMPLMKTAGAVHPFGQIISKTAK